MDVISLPIVEFGDPLIAVWEQMRDMNRSGVVARNGEEFWLLEAPDIVIALSERSASIVADLLARVPRVPIHIIDISTVATRSPGRFIAMSDLDIELRRSGLDYGLIASGQGWNFIYTRRQRIRETLMSSPRACYCTVGREPVPGGKNNDDCPNADGGKVRCV